MAKDKCFIRVEKLLKDSSIKSLKADEILDDIRKAQAEQKITKLDDIKVPDVAKDVLERRKLQKKINKRNAFENEIKIRESVEYVLKEFPENPEEGLIAILVGSNQQKLGSRSAVALQQFAMQRQLIAGFNQKLRENNLEDFFFKSTDEFGKPIPDLEQRLTRTIYELNQKQTAIEQRTGIKPPVTEKNQDIVKLATIMEEYSEMIRRKLNDRGANIEKLWGWIIRQSHDAYKVRDAAKVLGKKILDGADNYSENLKAWKEYVTPLLDEERTFANTADRDEFLDFAYNSLIKNHYLRSDGAINSFGSRNAPINSNDVTKRAAAKRVLHFKSPDAWHQYNSKFGVGSLKESFFAGLDVAGRNIGIMDTLGTKPQENFEKIRDLVARRLVKLEKSTEKISGGKFEKFLMVVDGRIHGVEDFSFAKWSAITRSIASMSKLGFAAISAMADVGLYASEMKYQGRSFLGGMGEALGSLTKLKNKKNREIAEQLGFIADNMIYDLAARYSIGDNLNKKFTKIQRTFFKANLLNWWTNSLKEGAMLGMANYLAKNKDIKFNSLNERLKTLLKQFNVDEVKWDAIRKVAMEKADDGREFFSVRNLDKLDDNMIKKITGKKNLTKRQIDIEREKFKASISGIFLDRSTFAVIEQDARVKATLTQGTLAGTGIGEAIRFFAQFKAFPFAIIQKSLSREISFFKAGNSARGVLGLASIFISSALLGYISMTVKDLLKGKTPRDPSKAKTFYAALLQGGGLGIYGDFLFTETKGAFDLLGRFAGPVPGTAAEIIQAIQYGIQGKKDAALKQSYRTVTGNIPFINLFYLKSAFDYIIGYQMMETLSPGVLRRIERKMKRDSGQQFLLTNPSSKFKGF